MAKKLQELVEKCEKDIDGLIFWKKKGEILSEENLQESLFVISTDIARYLGIRHDNLSRNISKLCSNKYLGEQLLTTEEMFLRGQSAKGIQKVYLFNPFQVQCLLISLAKSSTPQKKLNLCKIIKKLPEVISQLVSYQDLKEEENLHKGGHPLITTILEEYACTGEGIRLYRKKDVEISLENVLDSVFVLSSELADYFGIRHNNFILRNIVKLQKEEILPDHLLKIEQMVLIGSSTRRAQTVYALTRHQTYRIIMDLVGPRARHKKYAIVERIEALEKDLLQGAFERAQAKAANWDGISLIKQSGLAPALENIATRKEIAEFLKIPTGTLITFLNKNVHLIKPIMLNKGQKKKIGSRARRLFGYTLEDVVRISLWVGSPVGIQLKEKMFGKMALYTRPEWSNQMHWSQLLSIVFAGFDFKRNFAFGKYHLDFCIPELELALEHDPSEHKNYDPEDELKREELICRHFALVRFNDQVPLEKLFNAILKAKKGKVIRLYLLEENWMG